MEQRLTELRLKVVKLIGWNQYTLETIRKAALPFAVSVTTAKDYVDLNRDTVTDIDLVARFYIEAIMHTAAPCSGSSCLGAAASIRGTIPNSILVAGKAAKGGTLTFGHPSGKFSVLSEPKLAASLNDITFQKLAFPRTAGIICNGTIYIQDERPPEYSAWKEVNEITAAAFFLEGDSVSIQKVGAHRSTVTGTPRGGRSLQHASLHKRSIKPLGRHHDPGSGRA
jgi:PrpF protein